MKKLFLSLALVCGIAVTANAQWWVGGTASFMTEKTEKENAVQSYTFRPEVGYQLNDKWGLGVSLGYSYAKAGSTKGFVDGLDVNSEAYTINPFARYTFCDGRVGSLFVDGGVGYTYYNLHHDEKAHNISVGFKPGFALKVTNNFSVIGKLGWLGYDYYGVESGEKTHDYGLDLHMDRVELGAVYKF